MARYTPKLRSTGRHVRLVYKEDGHVVDRVVYTDGKHEFVKLFGHLFDPNEDLKKYWEVMT